MSEQEFENWLALLSGLLKLSPEQRNNISDELRSHLEERMEDLIDAGASREEAIAAALEEFGDTAALAQHFTSIAHQQRRRHMRYTYGTIAAVTCAILVLAAFWPGQEAPVTPHLIAQTPPEEADSAGAFDTFGSGAEAASVNNGDSTNPFQGSKERIEAQLAKPLPKIDYLDMTFRDVVFDLSDKTGVTITIDPSLLLFQSSIDPEALINLQYPEHAVSAKTLLALAFKAMGAEDLVGYTIRDNIVLITAKEDTTEVVIYNCRDLLGPTPPPRGEFEEGFGDAVGMMEGGSDLYQVSAQFGGGFGGGEGGMGIVPGGLNAGGAGFEPPSAEQQLIQVITGTIDTDSWVEMGGPGSIQSINGLIVINHTREVHDQVKNLLQLLREAAQEPGK